MVEANLCTRLERDFFLSYRYSQGDPGAQKDLFVGMGKYYAEHGEPIGEYAASEVPPKIMDIRPPRQHCNGGMYEQSVVNNTNSDMWAGFVTFAQGYQSFDWPDTVIPRLTTVMLLKDISYQHRERLHFKDPYASLFRQYVLLSERTGSLTFDHIYGEVRQTWESGKHERGTDTLLQKLQALWEKHHPGESFTSST